MTISSSGPTPIALTYPAPSHFPPSDTTPGWIQAYAKPSASGEAGARASILALGAQFSDGQSLPASWPLIMQTSKTLAAGNICVSVPSPGRSDPVTHATRPADLKDIAAFYGEQVPHSREALTERANDVKHANTFPAWCGALTRTI